jgi:hypothetical protein
MVMTSLHEQQVGLSDLTPVDRPPVYRALADHQASETWDLRELLAELQRWAGVFDTEFKLGVPEVSLCVDWLHPHCFGHFRYGHNGFGLRGEIALNRRYLAAREFWQILGTLLHELLHAWQQAHGTPGKGNYHNAEFRTKARSYGLVIDEHGCTEYEPGSAFFALLKKHGIRVPAVPKPQLRLRGRSKLRKWTCGCTNVRVASAHFRARCLNCGNEFALAD